MTKRPLVLFLSIFSVLILAACGNSSKESTGTADSTTTQDNAAAQEGQVKEITVKATNFKFEPSEIRVKKGEKIKLTLVNEEGVHGLMIHELNINIEGNGSAEFVADKVGEYNLMCSVMCGTGHGDMIGKIIVEE